MHGLQACLFKYITLRVEKMPLKGEFRGHALNSGNYIVDHGKIMELGF